MKKLAVWDYIKSILLIFLLFMITGLAMAQKPDLSVLEVMKARSIGPAGMSGRVVAIDAVACNPDIIYVGTASGGVWKSADRGVTWNPIFDEQKLINIGSVAICQSNPDVVWVGTGEGNPRNSINIGGGIFKSLDGGKTWKMMGLENTKNIHRIIIDPRDENVVYAGVIGNPYGEHPERGVFKTVDGGNTWEKILYVDEKTGVGEMVMDPQNPNKLLVNMWEHKRWPWFFKSGGRSSGLYVTLDGGENWEKRTPKDGLPKGELGRMGLAIAPSDPSIVYALIESKKNALYKSIDGGKTFKKINDSRSIGNRPFYYFEIYVDSKDPKRLYSLHSGITVSDDGGKSFTNIARNNHVDHHSFWIHPDDPSFIIEGNDGGLNISQDRGKTWRFVENIPVGQFYHIRVDDEIPYNVYGGLQDNGSWRGPGYVWKNGGIVNSLWQELMFGDGFDVLPDPDDARWGYAMSQQGNLGRYDYETGNSYVIKPTAQDMETKLRFHWNAPLEQDPFNNNTIYYGSQFLHKSIDKGLTWEIISPDLTTNDTTKQKYIKSGGLTYDVTGAETHTCIISVAPSTIDNQVIWVGTDDGNLQLTTDGGKNWKNLASRLPDFPEGSWIPQIKASTYDAGEAWVIANNYRRADFAPYAYHTTNYGESWERVIDEEKVFGYALCILPDPIVPNLVFLGTEHGLWVSFDKGINWQCWKHGVPPVSTMDLDLQEREADLVIGTFGRSIYILDDIRPLREIAATGGKVLESEFALFEPADAYIVDGWVSYSGFHYRGDAKFSGENKPVGAQIKFFIKKEEKKEEGVPEKKKQKGKKETDLPKSEAAIALGEKEAIKDSVKVMVYNGNGELVRTLKVKPSKGLNKITWRLDEEPVRLPTRNRNEGRGGRYRYNLGGKTVLPGSYKLVATYKGFKDSTSINVIYDPRIPKPVEVLNAQGKMLDELAESIKVLYQGTQRLIESKEVANKVFAQAKGVKTPDAKKLQKESKAVQDSIKVVQDFIFGKESKAQGITGRTQITVTSKIFEAMRYINSRPGKPTATEEKLLAEAKQLISESVGKINTFYKDVWPGYREMVESTQIPLFKDYEPLKF